MPVSRAKVVCFSAGLLLFIHLIVLDHAELEQCKSEQVEVDLAEHPLPVHYGICDDPNRKCFQQHNESCEPEQEFETIIKAKLVDHNGNSHRLHLHNDRKGFDVLLPEDGDRFTDTGIFHYKVMYKYETVCTLPFIGGCTGWVRDLRLSVTVVDFKLSLSPNSGGDILETSSTDIIELQVQSERNVSLLCSSGLSDKLSSLHIPATFSFYPKHDTDNHSVSVPCDSDDSVSINNDRWIITRQQLPPHDCLLTIVHFDRHDVGKYRCAGVLSRSDSPGLQVEDLSNKLYLKLLHSAGSPSQLGLWATVFFGVIVTSIIAIFLAFVAVVVYSAYRRHRRPPVYQVLPRFYGSTSTVNNDLSHPHTPIPNGISNVEAQLLVSYSSGDDAIASNGVSEIESSIDERRTPTRINQNLKRNEKVEVSNDHIIPNEQPQLLPQESPPSPSLGQEGVNVYFEHMHIQPAEGETPKDSTAPLNPNYRCPVCHKTYHDDQRLFWKRHWDERDKRCRPCLQDLTTIGAAVNEVAKPSERESEAFHLEQPSGSSEVNGLQVSSLAESTKSVGEQGRKIYGQYMDLQPAIGETPKDSNAPLNRNYRCPNCEKTYHDDQRSFWARHWNEREKRCIACTQDQPNAAHDDATVPSSSASTLIGDLTTKHCVTSPTLVDQTAAGSRVDQSDLNFMSESDSNPASSQSTSDLDSTNN